MSFEGGSFFLKILFHKNNVTRKFADRKCINTRTPLTVGELFEQELLQLQSIERPKIANFLPNFTPVIRKALTFVKHKPHF